MLQKKICMLGAFAVGKTSLVRRFVKSMFDEKYLTTVGVKIDKKVVHAQGQELMLMLWDMEGLDPCHNVRTSYVRGASGYLLIADGTRRETLGEALRIRTRVEEEIGQLPCILLLNKSDLGESWELEGDDLETLADWGITVLRTSAKTGEGVEEAFRTLADGILNAQPGQASPR